jgi:hypothetical protein
VTDRVAFGLTLIIVAALAADFLLNQGLATMFLLRKLEDLIIYVSFWR